jgi:FkbM family methyltransferase
VEIGATDGVNFSNTYLLEKYMEWNGIVVEPSPQYSDVIRKNRRCNIETKCVYRESGQSVEFVEVQGSSLSGITSYNDPMRPELRDAQSTKLLKETISLNDLLDSYEAPNEIDYISIDTEGTELPILQSFDFKKSKVKFFSVEHNFKAQRDEIYHLMQDNGYQRIHEKYSQWDDWYVLA